jgi:uncharacterized protein
MTDHLAAADESPFHPGEIAVQRRAGARDKIESIGRRVIRDFMPDQHREFFAQLPFFILGWGDDRARPWASALVGRPGFLSSPDPRRLHVATRPLPGDPLNGSLREHAFVGGLGIELHSRRRNRVNGKVSLDADGGGFTIAVDQSFGNCPQYIQSRELHRVAERQEAPVHGDRFDGAAQRIVERSDTFFIATHFAADRQRRSDGADVSHRGGLPGFVRLLDDRRLEFPDYRGNFLFNTLGNLTMNPRCGLLFLDFATGDVLQLSGSAEIVWEFFRDDPSLSGAERVIRFRLEESVRLPGAFPLRGDVLEYASQLRRD